MEGTQSSEVTVLNCPAMAGVFAIQSEVGADRAADALDGGGAVFLLDTSHATNRSEFFDAVAATLPLDPPLHRVHDVWDALADSLWEGLHELGVDEVVILWSGSDNLRAADPDEFGIACDVMRDLAGSLGDRTLTVDRPVEVTIYLAE